MSKKPPKVHQFEIAETTEVHVLDPIGITTSSPTFRKARKEPPTKEEILDAIFSSDRPRMEQRRLARERYGEEVTETELRNAEKKHRRKRGPQKRRIPVSDSK